MRRVPRSELAVLCVTAALVTACEQIDDGEPCPPFPVERVAIVDLGNTRHLRALPGEDVFEVRSAPVDGVVPVDRYVLAVGTRVVAAEPDLDRGAVRPFVDDYLASSPAAPLRFELHVETAVSAERTHRFTITYALADGDTFTVVTEPVTIGP